MTDMELIQALRAYSCQAWTIPNKAADRLEALLAENERLKAQLPKWRPASEPPKETGVYLVDTKARKDMLHFSAEKKPFIPAKSWYRIDDFGYPEIVRAKEIKSWMPLPTTEETR